jgi:LysM repeat protein
MKKKLILFLCLTAWITARAQKEKAAAYINTYKEVAISEMIRSGVPASITLAQGILESQYGESDLAKASNNHFGIKCKTEWIGPKTFHDDDEKGECFRVYTTVEASYRDHSDFLRSRPHYAFLFKLDPSDYESWAKGLKKAGYATSQTYPQQLLKVINDYDLQQYSLEAIARMKNDAVTATTTAVQPDASQQVAQKAIKAAPVAEEKEEEHKEAETLTAAVATELNTDIKKNTAYPTAGVFTINHVKVIYASEGISLLALANQYNIGLSKLLELNDLPEMDVLDTDRLIFLERKLKKGATDVHIVTADETLHDIAQKEGVRLESLLEYNNLRKEARPIAGEKLYLRTMTPVTAKQTKISR